jgi:1-deoxy-D-xylulose-5-phosphate reductoisomerase
MTTRNLVVLGSTGSIGVQTLEVLQAHSEAFTLSGLFAGKNLNRLAEQIRLFNPAMAGCQTEAGLEQLQAMVPHYRGTWLHGPDGLVAMAQAARVDTVVMGISGFAGLAPSLAALQAGKQLLTANKETFVAGGHLTQPYLSRIVPIDSEHSAIFQCLKGAPARHVKTVLLTASGGPFRTWNKSALAAASREAALRHPNWVMGPKICHPDEQGAGSD